MEASVGFDAAINPLAARLKNSPLLQHFGGPVPVYIRKGERGSCASLSALYPVTLEFEDGKAPGSRRW